MKTLIKFLVFFLTFASVNLAQVESTLTGGLWTSPGTWVNGVVPAPGDDVIIKGHVYLPLITNVRSLQIYNTGPGTGNY